MGNKSLPKKLLGVTVKGDSKNEVLEKIKKYISDPRGFFHIVSLNPENLILARKDEEFKKVIETAEIQIVDGVGVATAFRMLGIGVGERVTGVDLMEMLVDWAAKGSSTTMLIGGPDNLALELSVCYNRNYGQSSFIGLQGIRNIESPTQEEEREIFSIVTARRPRFVFVAFGSPAQEKWLYRNRASFQGVVCMGVGGAFDYLSGKVGRAPVAARRVGLEWLYRLVNQPWRWRRQLRLLKFIWLVAKQLVKSL